jgi:hypothetical protein
LLLKQQASKDLYMIRYFHPYRWKVYIFFWPKLSEHLHIIASINLFIKDFY